MTQLIANKLGTILFLAAFGASLSVKAQQDFQNLDFLSATVTPLPLGQIGGRVPFSNAFPGWTGYFGSTQTDYAYENYEALSSYNITIFDYLVDPPTCYALLQAGYTRTGGGPPISVSIAQTGLVPSWAKSIQMDASPQYRNDFQGFDVTLGGQSIPLVPVVGGTELVGDISSFAGQTDELRLTASPEPQNPSYTISIDDIRFSPDVVPEPGSISLLFLGLSQLIRSSVRKQSSLM